MALGLSFAAYGVPAYPGLLQMTNEDGTVTEVRLIGDENFSFFTDAEGLNIIERDVNGKWCNVIRNGRALRVVDSDINLLRSESVPFNFGEAYGATGPMKMATLTTEGRSEYPTVGDDIHALVVLLEYNDVPYTVPDIRNAIDRKCNQEGYSEYYGKGSARDYFSACSGGLFKPIFDVSEVVKLPFSQRYYSGQETGGRRNANFGEAIKYAIEKLDADGMDFSKYDYDKDGVIDNIFFYYSGHGQADTGDVNTIWPHQGNYRNYVYIDGLDDIVVDGVTMRTYACSSELPGRVPPGYQFPFLDGIGSFVHEYGHVLGLPDLYDVNYAGCKSPGKWDVMDNGSYNDFSTCPPLYSSYEMWACNWLEFIDLEDGNEYVLPALTEDNREAARLRLVRSTTGDKVRYYNEYFVIESRKKEGWDTFLPDEGMLIWHVNYNRNKWYDNLVNSEKDPRVEIMECNASAGYETWPGDPNFGGHTYTYPGFTDTFVPDTYGAGKDVYLTDIAYDAETGVSSFGFNMITEQPSVATVLHDNPTRNAQGSEVYLKWDAFEGAIGYMLTVTRTDSNGTVRYVDGLNDYFIGNITEYTVRNISRTAAYQTFNVFVRVVYGVPSKTTSNVIEFVPADLDITAVNEIGADADVEIYGMNGHIVAPEGARVWTVSGVETSTSNLQPGLYIVRYGRTTRKVVVK